VAWFVQEAVTNLKNALELSALFAYGHTMIKNREAPRETAQTHFLLGQCYNEMKDHKRALASYNEALKVSLAALCQSYRSFFLDQRSGSDGSS